MKETSKNIQEIYISIQRREEGRWIDYGDEGLEDWGEKLWRERARIRPSSNH